MPNNLDIGVLHLDDQHSPNTDIHQMVFESHKFKNDYIAIYFDIYICEATFESVINDSLKYSKKLLDEEPEYEIPRIREFAAKLRKYAKQFEALV